MKSETSVRSTIEQIATVLGGIDVLINNAGEIVVGPLDAMDPEDFKNALDIHFWAPFNIIFASLASLTKSPFARIVNIASFGGKVAVPHLAPYCGEQICAGRFVGCPARGTFLKKYLRHDRCARLAKDRISQECLL